MKTCFLSFAPYNPAAGSNWMSDAGTLRNKHTFMTLNRLDMVRPALNRIAVASLSVIEEHDVLGFFVLFAFFPGFVGSSPGDFVTVLPGFLDSGC